MESKIFSLEDFFCMNRLKLSEFPIYKTKYRPVERNSGINFTLVTNLAYMQQPFLCVAHASLDEQSSYISFGQSRENACISKVRLFRHQLLVFHYYDLISSHVGNLMIKRDLEAIQPSSKKLIKSAFLNFPVHSTLYNIRLEVSSESEQITIPVSSPSPQISLSQRG